MTKVNFFQNTGFVEFDDSSWDDHISQHTFAAAANWADWTQLKVRPSNVAVDPILWSIQRRASRRQSASLKPDEIRGCVFVLATSQSCLKQTNSAEQNRLFFSFSLCALTSSLIRVREDVPRCPEFQLGVRKHHLLNIFLPNVSNVDWHPRRLDYIWGGGSSVGVMLGVGCSSGNRKDSQWNGKPFTVLTYN